MFIICYYILCNSVYTHIFMCFLEGDTKNHGKTKLPLQTMHNPFVCMVIEACGKQKHQDIITYNQQGSGQWPPKSPKFKTNMTDSMDELPEITMILLGFPKNGLEVRNFNLLPIFHQ